LLACAKAYLIAAMYYGQVEVTVRDRIAAVISEVTGCSGRHFALRFLL